ncbi:hypothetical protein MZM54_01080 [[Brevibacterium] frigoritolerans]|nr:hypothetical protein [Peribacillus frigoritolerans]
MLKKIAAIIVGFLALYTTPALGIYSIVIMMLSIELFTVCKPEKTSSISFLVGMFLSEAYFLYSGTGLINLEYFVYVGSYLFIRHKGYEWFVDNKVNGYLYLLFAASMPVFLDSITRLAEVQLHLLLFVTLYLTFLRMSDWILTSKLPTLLFAIIQIVSAYSLENFILQDGEIYFIIGIILWTGMKWGTGGNENVSRIFGENLLRKSSKGVY